MFNICYKWKTPIELVFDKLIISLDGINISNSPRQIDYPKYTTLATDTIALNDTFQNYFKESFFGDVICENCCSVSSETRQATFTLIKLKLFMVKDEYFSDLHHTEPYYHIFTETGYAIIGYCS